MLNSKSKLNRMIAWGAIVLAMANAGCAGVNLKPTTELKPLVSPPIATLVVGEITRSRDLVISTGNTFYSNMQRELLPLISQTGLANEFVDERNLGPKGVAMPAYALRFRVVEDHVLITNDGKTCTLGLLMVGCVTIIPLFFMGLCTVEAEHRMTVEARLFDLKDASVNRVQDNFSNEMLNVYDTSVLKPLVRKEIPISLVVSHGVSAKQTGEEKLALSREEARETVRQALANSTNDISAVLSKSALSAK